MPRQNSNRCPLAAQAYLLAQVHVRACMMTDVVVLQGLLLARARIGIDLSAPSIRHTTKPGSPMRPSPVAIRNPCLVDLFMMESFHLLSSSVGSEVTNVL